MIRRLREADIDKVADIWLDTNIKTHCFIDKQYWQNYFHIVKECFPQSEVYVYEMNNEIQGFIGLNGEYIEGIFVSDKKQSQGIGRALLNYVKGLKKQLSLIVYQKNVRAVKFYQREKFEIRGDHIDESTGEKEYLMGWKAE